MTQTMWSMTIMVGRLFLIHFKRGDDVCPLCQQALVWRKVGERKYCPCDKDPVICMWAKNSPLHVVYRGEIIQGVRLLTRDNAHEFVGKPTFYALQPHVFTCQVMHRYTVFKRKNHGRD